MPFLSWMVIRKEFFVRKDGVSSSQQILSRSIKTETTYMHSQSLKLFIISYYFPSNSYG